MELQKRLSCIKNEPVFQLQKTNNELQIQLDYRNERCAMLEEQNSTLVKEKICIEKQLAEADYKYVEVKRDLEECYNRQQSQVESICDLEITIAENDVYSQALQENLDELEEICTTLREQRDEQHLYFLQRETSLKKDFDQQIEKLKKAKSLVENNFSAIKLVEVQLKDELSYFESKLQDGSKERERLSKEVEVLSLCVKRLEDDLKLEKDTVKMLQEKNNQLAVEAFNCKSEPKNNRNGQSTLSEETTRRIEELVSQFYEKQMKSCTSFIETRSNELSQQLLEYEGTLEEERRIRRDVEVKLKAVQEELFRTKSNADSLLKLNVSRSRNSLIRPTKENRRTKTTMNDIERLFKLDTSDFALVSKDCAVLYETPIAAHIAAYSPASNSILSSNDPFAFSSSSTKSAERIRQANENAIDKLKKLSLLT